MLEKVINDSKRQPTNRLELLLCLSALNLLNTWVKHEEYVSKLQQWEIKMQVSMLVKYLLEDGSDLVEDVKYNVGNKCTYIRCFGLQFGFHYVNLDNLTNDQRDIITVSNNIWDGIRLQEVAEKLYCETSAGLENKLSIEEIKDKLIEILQHG